MVPHTHTPSLGSGSGSGSDSRFRVRVKLELDDSRCLQRCCLSRVVPVCRPHGVHIVIPCRPSLSTQLYPSLLTPQQTPVDFLQDTAEAPIISKTWQKIAPDLRVHSGCSVRLR